jgi:hypothetical protein
VGDKFSISIHGKQITLAPIGDEACEPTPLLDAQIIAAALRRNPKRVALSTDSDGNVLIDKDAHPDMYDWAVNG